MYGKRDGVVTGLAITHNSRNQFHGTRGWKTGVVHDVSMLPRSEMFKPDVLGFTFSIFISFEHFFLCPQSSTLPTFLWPALPAKVSSPSKAHAMPHLGRAFTDVQECKQVLGSAIKKYVLNDKPPKRYSKNLFLWINATPGKTFQGWDSIVRWQQG